MVRSTADHGEKKAAAHSHDGGKTEWCVDKR
jgi:hypothetical protein